MLAKTMFAKDNCLSHNWPIRGSTWNDAQTFTVLADMPL